MAVSIEEKVREDDRAKLYAMPEFRRFLLDVADASGIARVTREEQQSRLYDGKRSLGLEVLRWFSADAEPFDVIADGVKARTQFTKGAKND